MKKILAFVLAMVMVLSLVACGSKTDSGANTGDQDTVVVLGTVGADYSCNPTFSFDSDFMKDPHVYQTTVKGVQADENGNICAITTVKLEAVYDESFRLSMKEIPGTEERIPCDMLLVAAGFIGPCGALAEAFGIDTDNRSNFAAAGYATSAAKVYACGDCRTGQSLVVKAMVDGRECAKAVDAALK